MASYNKTQIESELINLVDQLKAADAADLFLSPYISKSLLHCLTHNEGPAMWIINRSDVFSQTLQLLADHPDERMAQRAQHKLSTRQNPSDSLPAPQGLDSDQEIDQIPNADVEEILGHPRVPLRAVHRLSFSLVPEQRASSALSLTRRFLEYPPLWQEETISQHEVEARFTNMLLEDPSPYVRSYCTRIPFLDSSLLAQALATENHALVQGRLLQHPQLDPSTLLKKAEEALTHELDPIVECIIALDSRLPRDYREAVLQSRADDLPVLAEEIHKHYLCGI